MVKRRYKKAAEFIIAVFLLLVTTLSLVGCTNDARIVNSFLDKKELVIYEDPIGLRFNTYFFDKNKEHGLGRQAKDSDIFYFVKEGSKSIYNYQLNRYETYYFTTSTIFKWGEFLADSTDVQCVVTDEKGNTIGAVDFKNFTVDKGMQRVTSNDYTVFNDWCKIDYLAEMTDYGDSYMVLLAKGELIDFINTNVSFVKQNNLPNLIQWE